MRQELEHDPLPLDRPIVWCSVDVMHATLATTLLQLVNEHRAELLVVGNLAVAKLMAEQDLDDSAELRGRVVFTAVVEGHELVLRFDTSTPAELMLLNGFALN